MGRAVDHDKYERIAIDIGPSKHDRHRCIFIGVDGSGDRDRAVVHRAHRDAHCCGSGVDRAIVYAIGKCIAAIPVGARLVCAGGRSAGQKHAMRRIAHDMIGQGVAIAIVAGKCKRQNLVLIEDKIEIGGRRRMIQRPHCDGYAARSGGGAIVVGSHSAQRIGAVGPAGHGQRIGRGGGDTQTAIATKKLHLPDGAIGVGRCCAKNEAGGRGQFDSIGGRSKHHGGRRVYPK